MSAKYYAKRILKGIGKALWLFGKGIWFVLKKLGKGIGIAYRIYQERQRREEMLREHYRGIEREGRAYGRGMAQGFVDVRERERARRADERHWREFPDRFDKVVWGDEPTKKRKKKRSIFEL
jgi:hypothetical protein